MPVWIVLGSLSLVIALVFSAPVASGAVWVGAACFFAIVARIAQAQAHQRAHLQALAARPPEPPAH